MVRAVYCSSHKVRDVGKGAVRKLYGLDRGQSVRGEVDVDPLARLLAIMNSGDTIS